jgi:outer membrane receptor protein involved in Fe transport
LVPRQTPGQKGSVEESTLFSREDNFDVLLSFDKKITEDLNLAANVGANRMYKLRENKRMRSEDFEFNELQNVNSGKTNTHEKTFFEKEIQSVFGSVQFQYKNFYYLEMTARNDWSSTLPKENWSYFYPSVSSSFILSEVVDMPAFVSFAKIRGSWAEVGSDTDPYTLYLNYQLDNNTHDGITAGNIANGASPLYNLKPERTESVEFGADLKFFNNRLGLDFTWYKQNTFDQILDIGVSSSTSYDRVWVNAGEIENKGYEVMLYATPVKTASGFTWDVNFNFSKNQNKIIELTDEVEVYSLMSGAGTNSTVSEQHRANLMEPSMVILISAIQMERLFLMTRVYLNCQKTRKLSVM